MNFVDYINNNLSNYIIDNEWILLDVVIGKLINFIFEYFCVFVVVINIML